MIWPEFGSRFGLISENVCFRVSMRLLVCTIAGSRVESHVVDRSKAGVGSRFVWAPQGIFTLNIFTVLHMFYNKHSSADVLE